MKEIVGGEIMRFKNIESILFIVLLVILATANITQAGQQPVEAIAFQNEGDTNLDTLLAVSSLDDSWSPADVAPYGTISTDYYANGNDPQYLDAISLEFEPTGLDLTTLKLRCYLQKADYVNPFWEHYQLLPGKYNPHNQDEGGAGPPNFPPDVTRHSLVGTNLPNNTVIGWLEFPFDATSHPAYIMENGNIGLTLRLWNWRVDAVQLVGEPYFPFSDFSISEAKIEYDFDTSINDSFASSGEFTLGLGSSGIDPCNEDVVVTLGTFSVTIPGSFVQEDDKYIFEGLIDGANIYMKIEEIAANTFTFVVEADGVDFTGTENPTFIELVISDDYGSANIRLDGKLEFKGVK